MLPFLHPPYRAGRTSHEDSGFAWLIQLFFGNFRA